MGNDKNFKARLRDEREFLEAWHSNQAMIHKLICLSPINELIKNK